jgi:hypothetical protein
VNINDVYGNPNVIKPADLKESGPLKALIDSYRTRTFERDGKNEIKLELSLTVADGSTKSVTMNKTNGRLLAAYYGENLDGWVGKPVILYYDPGVQYQGKLVGGIKVKVPKNATTTAPPPPQDDDDDLV